MDSSSTSASCVGSNPTGVNFHPRDFLQLHEMLMLSCLFSLPPMRKQNVSRQCLLGSPPATVYFSHYGLKIWLVTYKPKVLNHHQRCCDLYVRCRPCILHTENIFLAKAQISILTDHSNIPNMGNTAFLIENRITGKAPHSKGKGMYAHGKLMQSLASKGAHA